MLNERMFHVIVIVNKTGERIQMTATPVTHKEGCILLSKLTKYSWRKEMMEEVV